MRRMPQTTKAPERKRCHMMLTPLTCRRHDGDVDCSPVAMQALPTPMHMPACSPAKSSTAARSGPAREEGIEERHMRDVRAGRGQRVLVLVASQEYERQEDS